MGKEKSWHKFLPDASRDICEENLEEFFAFMYERQQVWWRRNILKEKAPWTENEILRDFRFTNVYRFLDRSSQWLINNVLLDWNLTIEDLIFRIIIYRYFNQPDTFTHPQGISLPHYKAFKSQALWEAVVTYRENVGNPWQTAFLMNPRAPKPAGWNERGAWRDWIYIKDVFEIVHSKIPLITKLIQKKVKSEVLIKVLMTIPTVAEFMATEFYLDFCYIDTYWKEPIFSWTPNDHYNVGPGCSTGVRLIFPNLERKDQHKALPLLRDLSESELAKCGTFKYTSWNREKRKYVISNKWNLDCHQPEFVLCEYQKYWKMKIGLGKQRTKFIPKTIIT